MVNTTSQIVKVSYVPATKVHDAVSLTASGGNNTSNAIDIAGANAVTISVINGDSTDLDVFVYASYDNTTYDSLAYASMNVGASAKKTLPITPGPAYIKIKIQNNAGVATVVTTGINITYT